MMVILLSGCTGLRKLGDNEYLFSGAKVEFDSLQFITEPGPTKSELRALVKPSPNMKFLWMRPFLSIHNMVGEPNKEKGLKYWLKYKLGDPPVKLSDVNLSAINAAMVNRLENRGYFQASSNYEISRKRKTASANFTETTNKPYTIQSISFPNGNTQLEREVDGQEAGSLIKPKNNYKLTDFEKERKRIDAVLKNHGFFYFSSDYLIFDADTTIGNRQIDVELRIKPDIPSEANHAYRLGEIKVFDDYSLQDYHPDSTMIGNYIYMSVNHNYKPLTILDAIYLKKDSLYSRELHYNTLSHLMGLGVYKYANARFTKSDSLPNTLDVGIILTPNKKKTLGAELSAQLKTNNYLGPGLKLSYKNRNTFRGAEMLSINLGGRFETQFNGDNVGETNYEITLDGTLSIPRFVPFKFGEHKARKFVPSTNITLGGGLFSRVNLYELHSFYTSLGYHWRTSQKISQVYKPVDISFTNLAKSSAEFEDYLNQNPTIKRSFEEQFILGGSYMFTYSNFYKSKNRTNIYYSGTLETAGNLASLITTATKGIRPTSENPHYIFDVPYSQYVRLRNEIRFFVNKRSGTQSNIGFRVIVGNGIPYGNSSVMPYVKQFYVGGTNSVRAFRARTVGPGTYQPPDSLNTLYVDQSGDIKLESSIEYRFTIIDFLKGALFIDAGNIWLVSADPQRPGGKFEWDDFYRELAVGGGLGFRLDFSVVVVRFDFAYPLRKPYLPEGERWIFKPGDSKSAWNGREMVLNVAIGYPF
jgi:outer membrane protein assembly factor BamA